MADSRRSCIDGKHEFGWRRLWSIACWIRIWPHACSNRLPGSFTVAAEELETKLFIVRRDILTPTSLPARWCISRPLRPGPV